MICLTFKLLINFLNNTFFGTLFAGVLLSYLGLYLYKKQKIVDRDYRNLQELSELASRLFAGIDLGYSKWYSIVNVYDENSDYNFRKVVEEFDKKFNNSFQDTTSKEINEIHSIIDKNYYDLISAIKAKNIFTDSIDKLQTDIPAFKIYLLSYTILGRLDKDTFSDFKLKMKDKYDSINKTLQSIINH